MNGAFVISLDFELYWGVRDSKTLDSYGQNIIGGRKAIPLMLELFREFQIRATFATVGILFFETKEQLLHNLPEQPVKYLDSRYDWYPEYLQKVGTNETEDPYHFGRSLIDRVRREGVHELATHTFSHCYALEAKQNAEAFTDDLRKAIEVARASGVTIETIVFPRNQYDAEHLAMCKAVGIKGFRGNERGWMYEPRSRVDERSVRRLARLTDSYLNLTGLHTYGWDEISDKSGLCNIPASRFLRPFNRRLSALDGRRRARITEAMTFAAAHGRIFHLWWHPHNFGADLDENLAFLRSLLDHHRSLKREFDFQSCTMSDCYRVANTLKASHHPVRSECAAA